MDSVSRTSKCVLGVRVDRVSRVELVAAATSAAASGHRCRFMYANVHVLNTAYRDMNLRAIFNRAHLVYCDGAGVKLAARLLGYSLPERMTGADWIYDLCVACQESALTLYFLGGEPGVADQAAVLLKSRYPGLRIVGTHHGLFPQAGPENEAIIAEINNLRPGILLIGLGTPLQEQWIDSYFDRLNVPVVWAVGALMDFVAGKAHRGPRWMLDHGLEWLYRLWLEPGRLGRRYLVGNPLFFWRVLCQRYSHVKGVPGEN